MPPRELKIDAEMRDVGRALADKGFFEVDTVNGLVTWANEFSLQKFGYTLEQMVGMTLFNLVPEEFHDAVRNSMSEIQSGRGYKFSIRPMFGSTGELVWWYLVRIQSSDSRTWFRAEYLNTTGKSGADYASMTATMQTTNSYNELYSQYVKLQEWTEEAIQRLEKKDAELDQRISQLVDDVRQTKRFAETAANASLEMKQAMVRFQSEVANEMAKQTSEILRLISTDAIHDKRMETFEQHVKKATETAMKAITLKANEEGSDLARKVTIPVGLIATIAAIVQWVIQYLHR